jgi:hypothetical protein
MAPEAVAAPSDSRLTACGARNDDDGWIDEGQWQIVDDGTVVSEASGQSDGTDLATYDPRLLAAQTIGMSALIANGHAFESSDRGRRGSRCPWPTGGCGARPGLLRLAPAGSR